MAHKDTLIILFTPVVVSGASHVAMVEAQIAQADRLRTLFANIGIKFRHAIVFDFIGDEFKEQVDEMPIEWRTHAPLTSGQITGIRRPCDSWLRTLPDDIRENAFVLRVTQDTFITDFQCLVNALAELTERAEFIAGKIES